jgi:hypothetical protein
MMGRRYRVSSIKFGKSAILTPRPGSADPAGVTRLVLKTPRAGRGRLQVGKVMSVQIQPKPARTRGKARVKRPKRSR